MPDERPLRGARRRDLLRRRVAAARDGLPRTICDHHGERTGHDYNDVPRRGNVQHSRPVCGAWRRRLLQRRLDHARHGLHRPLVDHRANDEHDDCRDDNLRPDDVDLLDGGPVCRARRRRLLQRGLDHEGHGLQRPVFRPHEHCHNRTVHDTFADRVHHA